MVSQIKQAPDWAISSQRCNYSSSYRCCICWNSLSSWVCILLCNLDGAWGGGPPGWGEGPLLPAAPKGAESFDRSGDTALLALDCAPSCAFWGWFGGVDTNCCGIPAINRCIGMFWKFKRELIIELAPNYLKLKWRTPCNAVIILFNTCRALETEFGPAFCLAGGCDAVQYSSNHPHKCSDASSKEFSCNTISHISKGHCASFSAATNWTFICLVCDFPRDLTRRWRTLGEEI